MRCPSCGAEIADPSVTACATCGRALPVAAPTPPAEVFADPDGATAAAAPPSTPDAEAVAPETTGGVGAGASEVGAATGTTDAPAPAAATPEPAAATPEPAAATPEPAAMAPSGQPALYPTYPAYPPYPTYAPYGYGQMAPPSVPLAPGQAAPPSVPLMMGGQPMPPAYPPGYGPPSQGFVPPSQGFAPYPPGYGPYPQPIPDQPRRGRVGLVVGIVAAVLVVCVLLAAGLAAVLAVKPAGRVSMFSHASGVTPAATTATATPSENVIFQDDFSSPSSGWANDSHCAYGTGGYHILDGYLCYAPTGNIASGIVTAEIKQIAGTTDWYYGIALRRISKGNHYAFYITSDGYWQFAKVVNNEGFSLVPEVHSTAIHTGLNAVNTLKVRAVGSHFEFFINGTQVGQFDDNTFTAGLCGLSGASQGEVVATHFTVALVN